MNLIKIQSITKKICVALLGGFLLLFVLFHACANLCVLRHDDGAWYSAFCHFMGTNYIVKVFEVILLATILLHIILTVWLIITNYRARGTVRYHMMSRTKTHTGSTWMKWTGILLFALLIIHFMDFYFVKMDIVKGTYMVKTEEFVTDEVKGMTAQANQYGVTPSELINANIEYLDQMGDKITPEQKAEFLKQMDELKSVAAKADFYAEAQRNDMISEDGKYIKKISKEQRATLKESNPDLDIEPDFYTMVRDKFHNPLIVIMYMIFFVVVWFHVRHGFPSVFQTLGLNNYKYNKAIDIIGICFACLVFVAFAATPLGILAGI